MSSLTTESPQPLTTSFTPPRAGFHWEKSRRTAQALCELGMDRAQFDSVQRRMKAAQARCRNPMHSAFPDYGARGIEFRFSSTWQAALWVLRHLGAPARGQELDRIDNGGHYEPGNLRWSSHALNNSHTRRPRRNPLFHQIRLHHPSVRYADKTLRNLLSKGLTVEDIIERFHRPSDKPKGVYGIFSPADHDIASLPLTD